MISFNIQDMTCKHCVQTITQAVHALDPAATVEADLPAHRLDIQSQQLDAQVLKQAVEAAGYSPQPL